MVSASFCWAVKEILPLAFTNDCPSANVGEPEVVAFPVYLKESKFINQTSLVTASFGASTASDEFGETIADAGGGSVR